MNKKLLKVLRIISNAVIFIGLYGGIDQASAGSPMYFCIGEKHPNCEIQPVYDCDTSAHGVAQGLCTANTRHGPKSLAYLLTDVAKHDGDKCGYHMYKVECLTRASLSKLRNRTTESLSKFRKMEETMSIKPVKTQK